jgi:pilus assembly protein FimV
MRVQSVLGEPLRAQLSLGELTPEEFSSITAGFAPAAVYAAAGIVANPVLSNVQISIDKSIASNVVLNITSNSPMNEPFLDMLLEIKWASGKVVRDYTLLFTSAEQNTPLVSTEQVIVGAPSVSNPNAPLPLEAVVPSGVAVGAVVDAAPSVAQTPPSTTVAEAAPTPAAPTQAAKAAQAEALDEARAPNKRLRVVRGDTAAALAQANLPTGVSLDQMLQAMLRANPNAFVDGNVNRLKAGVELTLPDAQEAQAIDATQARRLVVAQSRDFNAYRRTLAANAPTQAQAPAGQVASGQIETQVQDKAAADPVADQLTLSKGSVATGTEAEAQIAAAKQAQDEQSQQADLTRNIEELKALAEAAPNAQGDGSAPADGSAGPTISPAPVAPEATAAAAPVEQAPSAEPPTMIQRLLAQPWALPVAFGLLALLVVLVVSRLTRRKKSQANGPVNVSAPGPAANDQRLADAPSSGLTFNLDDIDLDLSPADVQAETDGGNSEALFTKFELAKEFLSLGDRVAAKALAEEVQADATGLLKRRAELFLADLG